MELALRAHDKDRGASWKTVPIQQLWKGLQDEHHELGEAVERHFFYAGEEAKNIRREQVLIEAADLANFCMFMADRADLMQWEPRTRELTEEERDWATIEWAEKNMAHEDERLQRVIMAFLRVLRRKTK